MATSQERASGRSDVDFDLHGLAGIRLLDATAADAAAVGRQLGPIRAPLGREPDIVIRFVDRLPLSGRVRLLGVDDAGYTDDAFLVLRSRYKTSARVQISLDRIGDRTEFVCERGVSAVPLLVPILNLTVLGRGVLPLHAGAFVYEGTGVVTTGWSKGGKTETLLAFMARGAEYVGDEWIYVSEDGARVYGIPEPIRVWDWHLREVPQYRSYVGRTDRARLRAIKLVQGLERLPGGISSSASYRRLAPVLKRQLYVDLDPARIFARELGAMSASFDRLFFVGSHEAPDIRVEQIAPREVARRMLFSLDHERLDFMAYYLKFRFAFPELASPLVENAQELQRTLLERVLRDKPTYAVDHPYPVSIAGLFDAIAPLCR